VRLCHHAMIQRDRDLALPQAAWAFHPLFSRSAVPSRRCILAGLQSVHI